MFVLIDCQVWKACRCVSVCLCVCVCVCPPSYIMKVALTLTMETLLQSSHDISIPVAPVISGGTLHQLQLCLQPPRALPPEVPLSAGGRGPLKQPSGRDRHLSYLCRLSSLVPQDFERTPRCESQTSHVTYECGHKTM